MFCNLIKKLNQALFVFVYYKFLKAGIMFNTLTMSLNGNLPKIKAFIISQQVPCINENNNNNLCINLYIN